jgi:transposase
VLNPRKSLGELARIQSGEVDRTGGISKFGDAMMRRLLFDAAHVMLTRTIRWSWLKAWGMKIARHRGMKRAVVAVARRMAVIMHRMWADGTEFRWANTTAAVA